MFCLYFRESKEAEGSLAKDLEHVFIAVLKPVKDRYRHPPSVVKDRYRHPPLVVKDMCFWTTTLPVKDMHFYTTTLPVKDMYFCTTTRPVKDMYFCTPILPVKDMYFCTTTLPVKIRNTPFSCKLTINLLRKRRSHLLQWVGPCMLGSDCFAKCRQQLGRT